MYITVIKEIEAINMRMTGNMDRIGEKEPGRGLRKEVEGESVLILFQLKYI